MTMTMTMSFIASNIYTHRQLSIRGMEANGREIPRWDYSLPLTFYTKNNSLNKCMVQGIKEKDSFSFIMSMSLCLGLTGWGHIYFLSVRLSVCPFVHNICFPAITKELFDGST